MTTALTGAVELLDRALGYTRVVLAGVPGADLDRRTPCRDWNLGQLLAHMDDALDAFTEAAGGAVDVPARGWSPLRVDRLQEKACALLGAWSGRRRTGVERRWRGPGQRPAGRRPPPSRSPSTGGTSAAPPPGRARIPEELAAPAAAGGAPGGRTEDDRGIRFAPAAHARRRSRRRTSGCSPSWAGPDWSTGPIPADSRRRNPLNS